jgi:hypothetical protein
MRAADNQTEKRVQKATEKLSENGRSTPKNRLAKPQIRMSEESRRTTNYSADLAFTSGPGVVTNPCAKLRKTVSNPTKAMLTTRKIRVKQLAQIGENYRAEAWSNCHFAAWCLSLGGLSQWTLARGFKKIANCQTDDLRYRPYANCRGKSCAAAGLLLEQIHFDFQHARGSSVNVAAAFRKAHAPHRRPQPRSNAVLGSSGDFHGPGIYLLPRDGWEKPFQKRHHEALSIFREVDMV